MTYQAGVVVPRGRDVVPDEPDPGVDDEERHVAEDEAADPGDQHRGQRAAARGGGRRARTWRYPTMPTSGPECRPRVNTGTIGPTGSQGGRCHGSRGGSAAARRACRRRSRHGAARLAAVGPSRPPRRRRRPRSLRPARGGATRAPAAAASRLRGAAAAAGALVCRGASAGPAGRARPGCRGRRAAGRPAGRDADPVRGRRGGSRHRLGSLGRVGDARGAGRSGRSRPPDRRSRARCGCRSRRRRCSLSAGAGVSLVPVLPLFAVPLVVAVAAVNPGAGLWRPIGGDGPAFSRRCVPPVGRRAGGAGGRPARRGCRRSR